MKWLILPDVLAELREAYKNLSHDEILAFFRDESGELGARILTITGDTAQININGVLSNGNGYFSYFYGRGTSYPEIVGALAMAEADRRIKKVELAIDSPGGVTSGMFEAMEAIRNAKKPVKTIAGSVMASAAYGLGSQASGGVYAKSRASMIGSIGVAQSFTVYPEDIDITSTEAPKKRPDVTTDEGKAAVREELDAIHDLFVEGIAAGRKTTPKKVNADFGRGGVFLADKAKTAGMIDGIYEQKQTNGGKKAMDEMTLKELKANYPELAEQLINEGVALERDRVTAHLTMGNAYGDMGTAIEAVEKGTGMTETIKAKYLVAGRNKEDRDDRTADDADLDDMNADSGTPKDESDEVLDLVAAKLEGRVA